MARIYGSASIPNLVFPCVISIFSANGYFDTRGMNVDSMTAFTTTVRESSFGQFPGEFTYFRRHQLFGTAIVPEKINRTIMMSQEGSWASRKK
jgi:hypothetical protein